MRTRALTRVWLGLLGLFLSSFGAFAATPCVPDTVVWTPTPTLQWDHTLDNTVGFRVYWKHTDTTVWQGPYEIPVQTTSNEETGGTFIFASGRDASWPAQRAVPTTVQEQLVDLRVTAFNEHGESAPITALLCMPRLWSPGLPYN